MRKEVLFAIIAGGLFGAIIAFGIWRANVALSPKEDQVATTTSPSTPKPETEFGITVAKPEEGGVISESPTLISAVTSPNVWVALSAEEEDYIIKSDSTGAFEQKVDLIGGVNQIVIAAFSEKEEPTDKKLTVAFSTEFLKEITLPSEDEGSATAASDVIREKVQEKVEAARNNPKAYIGSVTDISESTLQIKNGNGEILQVEVDEDETTFVKITKKTTSVEFADVAIGDFIVAMGLRDENGVLDAKRVLITDPLEPTPRKAIYGEVAEVGKKKVVVRQKDGSKLTAEFGVKWVGPELDEINEGAKIIVVGTVEESTIDVRTLFIIPEESPSPTPSPTPSPDEEKE